MGPGLQEAWPGDDGLGSGAGNPFNVVEDPVEVVVAAPSPVAAPPWGPEAGL